MVGLAYLKKNIHFVLFALVSCVLMLSFFVHMIDFNHAHYKHDAVTSSAADQHTHAETSIVIDYFHAHDKKHFLIVLLSFLSLGLFYITSRFAVFSLSPLVCAQLFSWLRYYEHKTLLLRQCNVLQVLFSKGILNSKAY